MIFSLASPGGAFLPLTAALPPKRRVLLPAAISTAPESVGGATLPGLELRNPGELAWRKELMVMRMQTVSKSAVSCIVKLSFQKSLHSCFFRR